MDDLIDTDAGPAGNAPEFTVTELSGAVKRAIEGGFSHIRVRGEIGRVSRPRSGHVYLDLKDDRSVLSSVIWKGVASRLDTAPEEGLEVIATGRMTTFGGQSKYQLVIEDLVPAGAGALMAMLEKRRKMLEAEGLFAADRKRPLPYLPEVIGVVTSPSGAVIRDILHRLRDRFPRKVLIWPVAVQGQNCAPEVARAIEGFNRLTPGGALPRPDVLIVARGGGSLEDLWGFNEEIVVRAAAASQIPLISAVGHETDTTLIDHAADRRAPTPTAAAEIAVPVRLELSAALEAQGARLTRAIAQGVGNRGQRLRDVARALPRAETLLAQPRQRLDLWGERLPSSLRAAAQVKATYLAGLPLRPGLLEARLRAENRHAQVLSARLEPGLARGVAGHRQQLHQTAARLRLPVLDNRLQQARERLARTVRALSDVAQRDQMRRQQALSGLDRLRETLSYKATLMRGYAVVRAGDQVVTTKAAAQRAGALDIEFADGKMAVGQPGSAPPGGSAPKSGADPRPSKRPKDNPPDQGSLF